jgi:hypothetical protein
MGLVGFRHGDAHFTLPAEQRRERGFKLRQVPGDGGSVKAARLRLPSGTARTSSTGASRPPRLAPGHLLALPSEIGACFHVLEGAAAASAEILADRGNTLRAWLDDGNGLGARLPWLGLHIHQLTRK